MWPNCRLPTISSGRVGNDLQIWVQLRNKRTIAVWWISMADLLQQSHQRVEVVVAWCRLLPLNIDTLYNNSVSWRVWAAIKAQMTSLPYAYVFKLKAMGKYTPTGRMQSERTPWTASCLPCICPASYQGNSLPKTLHNLLVARVTRSAHGGAPLATCDK